MEDNLDIKKRDKLMIFTFASLALSLVSTITYMIYTIATSGSFVDHVVSIIGVIILVVFAILLVVAGFFIENKKAKIFIAVASLILAFYSIFQVIIGISKPKDFMPDFTNTNINKVISWAEKRDIDLYQKYAHSDKIDENHVIDQSIKEGTAVKKIKELTVTVSKGPDSTKKTNVGNMVGWDLDDVIDFIDKNHLTNVTIKFEFSDTIEKDKIISQDVIKDEIERKEPITLVSSLGKEKDLKDVKIANLIGMDTFHATVYLGRNNIKYSLEYAYDKDKDEGTVLKQSIKKWTIISPNEKKQMVLTLASIKQVTLPDIYKMTKDELLEWATKNRVRLDYREEFDDSVKDGYVISCNYDKGAIIPVNTIIDMKLSKGQVKMIEFTDIDSFRKWASEKEITYNIEYEYSDDVEKGKVISISHKKGQTIKNTDTVEIVISYGGNATIPNLVGLSKQDANDKCKKANIKCSFTGDSGTVTKQSMAPDSTVPAGTTVTVTLSN